ncbi:MAG: DUF799 family lipoprotein [Syntrophales bacterium]|nr:DUF799 family lipoprotein [Syntrophales bacterium]
MDTINLLPGFNVKKGSVIFVSVLLSLLIASQGCVVATKKTVIAPEIITFFKGTYKVDPYMEKHKPRTVAVLPFFDQSRSKEGFDTVRRGFYNHFSSLPFKDMELYRVDNLLKKAGLADPEVINKTSPQELGKILDVDAVVFGEISNFDKLFAVVYSQVSVGAEIKMYDTRMGNFLWSGKHTVRLHEGGISTTPVGLIATVIATSMNMRDVQLLRACDDLFRDMVKTIPVPAIAEALRPPVITLLTQDTKGLPRKAGDEIKVVIQGTPKMQAHFDIGEYKKHIVMQEVEPGGYLGVYRVVPGDNVTGAIITGYLTDDSGNTSQWVDAIGTVTIDTTPPEKVKDLTGVGRNALVLLSWDKSAASDLAGYHVYRSTTPLSGFQEIAKTEFNELRDGGLVNFREYYYQVTAIDRAGNESEKTEAVVGIPVAGGPTPVSGAIETDTTWYSGASPYVIEDTVFVKDKARLTVEAGTEIRSKGSPLVIEGQLIVRGDGDHLILFDTGQEGKRWEGIVFNNVKEKENLLKFCRIRNAKTGITCQSSSPLIEACELADNDVAIRILGAFSRPQVVKNTIHKNRDTAVQITGGAQPTLKENRIQDNAKEGIVIQAAAPVIQHNMIVQNRGSGIVGKSCQATIKENNITGNRPFDMVGEMTGEAINALNNWWGSTEGLVILSRIQGRINIKSVLNAAYPEGKPLELPILPQVLGSPIKTDAFLILSNSPYRVAKDVVIDGGATLYIEPGVTIMYDQNTSIIVGDGGVVARGIRDHPILFTASGATPSPGFYTNAIRLTKLTRVNSFFNYCVVKNATTAFDIYYGAPEISFCHIAYNAQSGIYCRHDAAPKISYSTFTRNLGEGGIKCVGMSNPSIKYNNFADNMVAVQTFSSIYIDARYNWWGSNPPDQKLIWGENINIKPWLESPDEKAFTEPK